MTRTEALDAAMFAVNTLLSPEASSDSDFAAFMDGAEDTLRALAQVRDEQTG